jgi:hypothetical protein
MALVSIMADGFKRSPCFYYTLYENRKYGTRVSWSGIISSLVIQKLKWGQNRQHGDQQIILSDARKESRLGPSEHNVIYLIRRRQKHVEKDSVTASLLCIQELLRSVL